ncbi:MAG TPA: PQQ-dependent sugar dehydrogenase [Candidatus Krumholzibacteria bacterium]|nr:PQQ-dependent sugar dehydrogenase [Candidatus Krumholzibacteria bacterium]
MVEAGIRKRPLRLVLALLGLAGMAVPARAGYQVVPAYPGLTFTFVTDIQRAVDGSNRMFVLEKAGTIRVFDNDYNATTSKVFLDISYKVRTYGEAGLLGLAFDPDYASNGTFYIFYSTKYPTHTIVSRMHVSADPDVADPASEEVLFDIPQPDPSGAFHNGGQLAFGPDGFLYIGLGDNLNSAFAQDLTDLRGSILRIDVHVDPQPLLSVGTPLYQIPTTNPFVGNTQGYRPEIYAYGFRNPWRFYIDRFTGEVWACDVGEDTYEEIDMVHPGYNYGWPLMEGPDCYIVPCDTTGKQLRPPLYYYTHADGAAIVGGARYWGSRLPELAGLFIFADYTSSVVWGLHYDGAAPPERFELATGTPGMNTVEVGFSGEVLMGGWDGKIYRLDRTATAVNTPLAPHTRLENFPNPFNPSTTIRFVLERPGRVQLDIVSVTGERVRWFDLGARSAGAHDVVWRGDTRTGNRAPSGVYYCRLLVDGIATDSATMVMVQ